MRKITFLLIVMVYFVSGCVTTGTTQVSKGHELLASSRKIVNSADQLTYDSFKCEDPIKFSFDEQAFVIEAGTKRRFAKGFALPTGIEPYSISITSLKLGSVADPAILYPEVQLLDKDYRVIRTLPSTDFVFRQSMTGGGLNTVLFVNSNSQGERYLLLSNRLIDEADLITCQDNITGSTPVVVPVPGVGVFMWNIPSGNNTPPIKMKASPTGQMEVVCQAYRPKKLGQ
jgi:hypothetical protein